MMKIVSSWLDLQHNITQFLISIFIPSEFLKKSEILIMLLYFNQTLEFFNVIDISRISIMISYKSRMKGELKYAV